MLINQYLLLLQSQKQTYQQEYLSSSFLRNDDSSSNASYINRIEAVAKADAQNDLKNSTQKNWQNSKEFLKLKDEFVYSDKKKDSFSLYNSKSNLTNSIQKSLNSIYSFSTSSNPIDGLNKAFSNAMQQAVSRNMREGFFVSQYNTAYKTFKNNANKPDKLMDTVV